jgi:hypothetical protein
LAYREKIGWLSLIAMAVTFGPYFMAVAVHAIPDAALPNLRQLFVFGITAVTQALIIGMGHLYFRRSSPEDARMPPDERDKAIMQRSISTAYYVLIAGMIMVGVMMPFNSSGWKIVNAALFMIVTAEVVHYGVVVASYRRQAS